MGYEVFVHTDHSTIRYLMNKPTTNGRITRWLLLLQKFNIIVLDSTGKENQVVDFLSELNHVGDNVLVNDSFLDENLFAISFTTPWFVDMANYLPTGKLSPYFLSNRTKRIIRKSVD